MNARREVHWYSEPTMILVAGILCFALLSGLSMLWMATNQSDTLLLSDEEYAQWRDDMRATTPPSPHD